MGESRTKFASVSLQGGISDKGFDVLNDGPQLRSIVNLRAPRLHGIASRPFAPNGVTASLPFTPTMWVDDGTGISVLVNMDQAHDTASGSVSMRMVGGNSPFQSVTASTGRWPGQQIVNAWIPTQVQQVFDDQFGSSYYGNVACRFTAAGNVAIATLADQGTKIIAMVIDPVGRTVVPPQGFTIGTGSLATLNALRYPIRMTCHDDESVALWWNELELGIGLVTGTINMRRLPCSNPATAVFGPEVTLATYTDEAYQGWSVATAPGQGVNAFLAASSTSSYADLVISKVNTSLGSVATSTTIAGQMCDFETPIDVAAFPSGSDAWVSVGFISGSRSLDGLPLESGQVKVRTYRASDLVQLMGNDDLAEGARMLDQVAVGHSQVISTAPSAVVFMTNTQKMAGYVGTRAVTVNSFGGGVDASAQWLSNKVPYGNVSSWTSGSVSYPVVPMRHANGPTNDPTTEDVVLDPSIEVYMGRPYGITTGQNVRWTFDSVARTAVDELPVERDPGVLNVADIRSGSLLLGRATSQYGLASSGDAVKVVSWRLNPPEVTSVITSLNGGSILCGQPMFWDGFECVEPGFLHAPVLSASKVGGFYPMTGTHQVQALYSWRNAKGELHRSSPSLQMNFEAGSGCQPSFYVGQANTVRSGTLQSQYEIELYVSEQNGTIAYRQPLENMSSSWDSTRHAFLFKEIRSGDPTYPSIYSDGSEFGEIGAEVPPALWDGCEVGNRLWGIDAENRSRLIYTKPKVQGIAHEWNVFVNNILLDSAAGKAIAVREMQGYPIVFCENGIYVIAGEGPNSLGFGDFGRPQRIVADGVHPESRMLATVTPQGVFFRGTKSYAFLRSINGQVDRIFDVDDSYTAISARYVDATEELLLFLEGRTLTIDPQSGRFAEVTWSGKPNPRGFMNTTFDGTNPGGWLVLSGSMVGVEDVQESTRTEDWTIETGWIAPPGNFMDSSFSDIIVDCVMDGTGSGLVIEQRFNFDDSTTYTSFYSVSDVVTASMRSGNRPRLRLTPLVTDAVSMKLVISESAPQGRAGQGLLPVQLLIGYSDMGKEATPSESHMGDKR